MARRTTWIQLPLFPHATRGESEILKAIVSASKRKLGIWELREKTSIDLYVEEKSVQTMCRRLVQKDMLKVVGTDRGDGDRGKLRYVYSVTPRGEEALQWSE